MNENPKSDLTDDELAEALDDAGLLAPLLSVALDQEAEKSPLRRMLEDRYPGLAEEQYEMLEYIT